MKMNHVHSSRPFPNNPKPNLHQTMSIKYSALISNIHNYSNLNILPTLSKLQLCYLSKVRHVSYSNVTMTILSSSSWLVSCIQTSLEWFEYIYLILSKYILFKWQLSHLSNSSYHLIIPAPICTVVLNGECCHTIPNVVWVELKWRTCVSYEISLSTLSLMIPISLLS